MVSQRSLASDLKVPVVCLGGNIFGAFLSQKDTFDLLDYASEQGAHFVDTADVYSEGLSEQILGNYFSKKSRKSFILSTKAGLKSGGDPRGLGSRKSLTQRLDESLRRLRTDYIDLYQVHHYDPETPLEETLETLFSFIQQGKIRYAGVSNFSAKRVEELSSHETPWLVSNQIKFNILKRDWAESLQLYSIGLLAYGVLGRGVLTGKYIDSSQILDHTRAAVSESVRNDLNPEVHSQVKRIEELSHEHGVSLLESILQTTLREKKLVSMMIGVRSIRQLREVIQGCSSNFPTELADAIQKELSQCSKLPESTFGKDICY